jgi:hypothetical protein
MGSKLSKKEDLQSLLSRFLPGVTATLIESYYDDSLLFVYCNQNCNQQNEEKEPQKWVAYDLKGNLKKTFLNSTRGLEGTNIWHSENKEEHAWLSQQGQGQELHEKPKPYYYSLSEELPAVLETTDIIRKRINS